MATGMKMPEMNVPGQKMSKGTMQPPTPGPATPSSMPVHKAISTGQGSTTMHAGHTGRGNMDKFHVGDMSHDHSQGNDGDFEVTNQ